MAAGAWPGTADAAPAGCQVNSPETPQRRAIAGAGRVSGSSIGPSARATSIATWTEGCGSQRAPSALPARSVMATGAAWGVALITTRPLAISRSGAAPSPDGSKVISPPSIIWIWSFPSMASTGREVGSDTIRSWASNRRELAIRWKVLLCRSWTSAISSALTSRPTSLGPTAASGAIGSTTGTGSGAGRGSGGATTAGGAIPGAGGASGAPSGGRGDAGVTGSAGVGVTGTIGRAAAAGELPEGWLAAGCPLSASGLTEPAGGWAGRGSGGGLSGTGAGTGAGAGSLGLADPAGTGALGGAGSTGTFMATWSGASDGSPPTRNSPSRSVEAK